MLPVVLVCRHCLGLRMCDTGGFAAQYPLSLLAFDILAKPHGLIHSTLRVTKNHYAAVRLHVPAIPYMVQPSYRCIFRAPNKGFKIQSIANRELIGAIHRIAPQHNNKNKHFKVTLWQATIISVARLARRGEARHGTDT